MPPEDLPGPGVDAYEIFRKIDQGEIKGLLSICFNPVVSLPDNHFVSRMLDKLEFYVAIDFFLNDGARHADIVLPGSLQEEDEGIVTTAEGRDHQTNDHQLKAGGLRFSGEWKRRLKEKTAESRWFKPKRPSGGLKPPIGKSIKSGGVPRRGAAGLAHHPGYSAGVAASARFYLRLAWRHSRRTPPRLAGRRRRLLRGHL